MSSSTAMTMTSMASATSSAVAAATSTASSSHSGMSMGDSSSSADSCKISMLWNWNTIDACFLSSTWHIQSNGMFAVSCIGVAFLVVALEFFRRLGKEYDAFTHRQFQRNAAAQAGKNRSSTVGNCSPTPQYLTFRPSPLQQFIRSLIHMVTFGIAYIVMLLAMYFNGYIILSIVVGAFLGKFLCDWSSQKIAIGSAGEEGKSSDALETTFCCG